MTDTIFALATARGRAGVAVVRISGPDAHAAASRLAGPLPEPRRAGLRVLRDSAGERLDEALVLVFLEGASYTAEPLVEFQLHGSVAVVAAVLDSFGEAGLRLAEPGEFTRRALLNGRLTLSEVEGIGDLIAAETAAQRRQANALLENRLGATAERWRGALLRAAALLTVTIDFADEDVPADIASEALSLVGEVRAEVEAEIAGSRTAERLRDGFEIAIMGPPNAGKSTLINYLAGRRAALTSEVAGTTRDVIEVRMDLGGLPVTLLDTAGLRDAEDAVEVMGVEAAVARARAADLRIFLADGIAELPLWLVPDDIIVRGKTDIGDGTGVSGRTGEGVTLLTRLVEERLGERVAASGVAVNARHRQSLESAVAALGAAELHLDSDAPELAAEELRAALNALDRLVGRVDVEDVLDQVFAGFCLGK